MVVQLIEISSQWVHFRADHQEYKLAPVVAANILVTPSPKEQLDDLISSQPLAELRLGEQGKVISISPACRGPERRRFMDLGILPGAIITAEMRSPGGDPTAYRIRGALIALRQEQAKLINVLRIEEVHP
jgi:Fe2+ transport system protein FeoA